MKQILLKSIPFTTHRVSLADVNPTIEVLRRVYQDGLPETKKAFTEEMYDWFMDQGIANISVRTIGKKIGRLFDVLSLD